MCVCVIYTHVYVNINIFNIKFVECSGHFLLTNLLLDDLKATAASEGGDARVVVISSGLHDAELAKKRGRQYTYMIYSLLLLVIHMYGLLLVGVQSMIC